VDDPSGDPWSGEIDRPLVSDVRVRLMAANLTSGTQQSYDPGHGIRIFQGVKPDVAMIQEFNYGANSAADLRSFVDQAFGTTFSYCREAGAQIPNGVVSRYPILQCGEWDDPRVSNRDFSYARIDIPGPVDLWAVSVHLLTTSTTERNLEAQSLVSYLTQNVPDSAYLAIAGDFNTGSRTESCLTTLSSKVVTSGPYPVDQNGNGNTNASRAKPYDWVLVDPDLHARRTSTVIGASSYASGLVVDTRVYTPLSEISPAQFGDSGATNMQHMGVVRDFLIPSDTPASVTVTSPNGGESWAGGSSHAITWTSSGLADLRLEYTLDGTSWNTITSSTPASAGSYSWTLPTTSSTAARVRASDAAGSGTQDQSDGTFTITGGGGGGGTVFINEVVANEPGSDTASEAVELVNPGSTAVSIAGWTVSDSVSVRHTFASGTSIPAGGAIAVFGGATGIPGGLTNAVAASTGTLGLSNSGDSVVVRNASGVTVDSLSYSSSLAGTDGVSMNRSPDATAGAALVLHTSISSLSRSPGKRADGTDFGGSAPPPSGSVSSESEANDTAAAADGPVGNAKDISGAISSSTDQDWFRIPVKSAGTLSISLSISGTADLDWFLSTEANPGTVLVQGYTSSNPETGGYAAAANTVYLLKVNGYLGAQGSYTLRVTAPAATLDP
jgi:endonuclease/exonuclease/phosphatase family metal-dependent hydrolase